MGNERSKFSFNYTKVSGSHWKLGGAILHAVAMGEGTDKCVTVPGVGG